MSHAAIAASIEAYVAQLTTDRDVQRAADFFVEDVRLIGPDTDLDREGMVESIQAVFEAKTEVVVNRRTIELFVHGNSAYEIAQAEDTFLNPDGSSNIIRNNMFIRWERGSDGKWRFSRVLLSPMTLK